MLRYTWMRTHGGNEFQFADDPSQNYYGGTQTYEFLKNKQDIIGVRADPNTADDPSMYSFIPYHSIQNWYTSLDIGEAERPVDTFCGGEAGPGRIIYNGEIYYDSNMDGAFAYTGIEQLWPMCGQTLALPSSITVTYDGSVYTIPKNENDWEGYVAYGEIDQGVSVMDHDYPIFIAVDPYGSVMVAAQNSSYHTTHNITIGGDFSC